MSPPVPPDFYILSEEIPSSTPFTDMIVDSSTDLEASTPSANTSLFDDAHIDPSSGGDIPGQAMQPAASSSFKYFIDPRLDQKAVDAVTSPRMPAAISDFVDGSKYPTNNPATWPPGENGRLLEMQDLQDKHSMDQMAPMQMPTAQVQMHTPQMQMSMPFQTQVSSPYPLTTVHARRGRKSYQSHGPHQHFMQFPNMQAAALNHANSFKSSHTSTASLSVRWHPNDFAPMQGTQFNSRYGPEYFAFPQASGFSPQYLRTFQALTDL